MGSDQNNKKPIEVDSWVFHNLGRVVSHLISIERENMCNPGWLWKSEDLTISGICTNLQGYILTPKGAQLLPQIAELEADKARQYTNKYCGLRAICDLVEFARRRTTKPEELEINQVAPLDKTPRAEEVFNLAQPKTKHRPNKSIDDCILADDKDGVKLALQKFLKNKRAKDCAIIVWVFMGKGYLQRTPYCVLKNAFNINCSKQGYNQAFDKAINNYYILECDTIKQALENQFPNL